MKKGIIRAVGLAAAAILIPILTSAVIVKIMDQRATDIPKIYERVITSVVDINGTAGFVVENSDTSSYIATAYHAVNKFPPDSWEFAVKINDGDTTVRARVMKSDREKDIAILETSYSLNIPPLQIGDSSELKVGEPVIIIGHPLGYERSITAGILSGIRKNSNIALQFDALVEPGNSGGPVLNRKGQVVGITTAMSIDTNSKVGRFGFAAPSIELKRLMLQKEKITNGKTVVNFESPAAPFRDSYLNQSECKRLWETSFSVLNAPADFKMAAFRIEGDAAENNFYNIKLLIDDGGDFQAEPINKKGEVKIIAYNKIDVGEHRAALYGCVGRGTAGTFNFVLDSVQFSAKRIERDGTKTPREIIVQTNGSTFSPIEGGTWQVNATSEQGQG